MVTIGFDPGTANVGWAVVEDGKHVTSGIISGSGKTKWPIQRGLFLPHLQRLIGTYRPDLVAVEGTQMSGRVDDGKSAQAVFSMGINTQRTEELAGLIIAMGARIGADSIRIHPQTGLSRLGLKRGATDGQVAKMFTAMTGIKLRATEAHQARALGVALAGEARAAHGATLAGLDGTE